jgi:hypothetical protein
MEYTYSVTTLYDGELVNTLRVSDMLEAVDAWTKCVDFGTQPIIYLTQQVKCIQKLFIVMVK